MKDVIMKYDPRHQKLATFHDAVPAFIAGTDTPTAYLERCLAVIEEREPVVKAWVTYDPKLARVTAEASTARYKQGKQLSQIDGIPIGVKDLILTKDFPTQMGSPLYRDNFPHQDSAAVRALRDAGAIILGKTVTTELGMSTPGPTTNPFDPTRTPGGSSSGSAAAVGAGMVPATIGTQVVGSIIRPSGFCANYSLKPTYGAINRGERQGYSQSHFGVHAGSLEDMWLVSMEMAVRCGGDPGYPGLFGTAQLPESDCPSHLIVMEGEGWKDVDPTTRDGFEQILKQLKEKGVKIVRRGDSELVERFEQGISESMAMCRDLCGYEMRWSLENLVEKHPNGISDSLMGRLKLARTMNIEQYRVLLQKRHEVHARHAALAKVGDVLISLSSLGPAPLMGDATGSDPGIAHTTGSPVMNATSSVLHAPTVTLPLLAVGGMPVGIQILGQKNMDEQVVGYARWLTENVAPVSVG